MLAVESVLSSYEASRSAGIRALSERDLLAAREHFERALEIARDSGDPELADRAFCNRAAIDIERGCAEAQLPRLREILLHNRSPGCAFLAAYNLAEAHQLDRNHRKALFYCTIARDRAHSADRPEWLASSLNRLGNVLVALHRLEEARASYLEAASRLPPADLARRASIEQNLGYIDVLEQRPQEGARRLLRAWRMQSRAGRATPLLHLDLAAAYLALERPRLAGRHAERALALCRHTERTEALKNSLLLVARTRRACGANDDADRALDELASLYPDHAGLAAIFGSIDLLSIVNLRA